MKIKIVFNNTAVSRKFATGWGFSCLVGDHILFDTGEKAKYLSHNMKIIGVDISQIKAIIISHDHWDHTGGLAAVLKKRRGIKVYICPNFSQRLKNKLKRLKGYLIESYGFSEVIKNIFVTGKIPSIYKSKKMPEQALVIRTENGITIVTGCAHPGIVEIIEKVKDQFPQEDVYAVLGGFHLNQKSKKDIKRMVQRFKEMSVKKAGPAHCSGKVAERNFEEVYKSDFIPVITGLMIEV